MFQFLKNDKSLKKDIRLIFLIAIVACLATLLFSFVAGCASQAPREDSAHQVAQTQPQGYPCQGCGFSIPMENISANIRIKNECSSCGKIFLALLKLQRKRSLNHNKASHTKDQKFLGEDIILTLHTKTNLTVRAKVHGRLVLMGIAVQ